MTSALRSERENHRKKQNREDLEDPEELGSILWSFRFFAVNLFRSG
jgi:hypothetical protein